MGRTRAARPHVDRSAFAGLRFPPEVITVGRFTALVAEAARPLRHAAGGPVFGRTLWSTVDRMRTG